MKRGIVVGMLFVFLLSMTFVSASFFGNIFTGNVIQETGWTGWYDRDDPSGKGDYDSLSSLLNNGYTVCDNPTQVECRTTTGLDWTETGDVYHCNIQYVDSLDRVQNGPKCLNVEQSDGSCNYDYEVRFYCGATYWDGGNVLGTDVGGGVVDLDQAPGTVNDDNSYIDPNANPTLDTGTSGDAFGKKGGNCLADGSACTRTSNCCGACTKSIPDGGGLFCEGIDVTSANVGSGVTSDCEGYEQCLVNGGSDCCTTNYCFAYCSDGDITAQKGASCEAEAARCSEACTDSSNTFDEWDSCNQQCDANFKACKGDDDAPTISFIRDIGLNLGNAKIYSIDGQKYFSKASYVGTNSVRIKVNGEETTNLAPGSSQDVGDVTVLINSINGDLVDFQILAREDFSCSSFGGCELNDQCYSIGYRYGSKYCSEGGDWERQVRNKVNQCTQNFECGSNICIDGSCVNQGAWERFNRWFGNIFGGSDGIDCVGDNCDCWDDCGDEDVTSANVGSGVTSDCEGYEQCLLNGGDDCCATNYCLAYCSDGDIESKGRLKSLSGTENI